MRGRVREGGGLAVGEGEGIERRNVFWNCLGWYLWGGRRAKGVHMALLS